MLELHPPYRSGGCRQREKRGDPGDGEGRRWSCPGPVQRPAAIPGRQQLLLKRGGGGGPSPSQPYSLRCVQAVVGVSVEVA